MLSNTVCRPQLPHDCIQVLHSSLSYYKDFSGFFQRTETALVLLGVIVFVDLWDLLRNCMCIWRSLSRSQSQLPFSPDSTTASHSLTSTQHFLVQGCEAGQFEHTGWDVGPESHSTERWFAAAIPQRCDVQARHLMLHLCGAKGGVEDVRKLKFDTHTVAHKCLSAFFLRWDVNWKMFQSFWVLGLEFTLAEVPRPTFVAHLQNCGRNSVCGQASICL